MHVDGVHCAVHADRASIGTCQHCGAFACADCLGSLGGQLVCRACVDAGRVGGRSPWENRAQLGLLPAAWETVRQVTLTPTAFYEKLGRGGELGDVVSLLLILGVVQGVGGALNGWVMNQSMATLLGVDQQSTGVPFLDALQGGAVGAVMTLVLTPIFNVIGPIVVGSIAHGIMALIGRSTVELPVTLRYVCYAYAVGIWGAIPIVGMLSGMLASLWTLVVAVIAVKAAHRSTWGPAVAATLGIPCACVGLVAFGAALVAVFAARGGAF